MRYFFDTEFIEDGKTIDLISIGIVCEDNREYYAINYDCDFNKASEWVQDNVLSHLPFKPVKPKSEYGSSGEFIDTGVWRRKSAIAKDVASFTLHQPTLIARDVTPDSVPMEGAFVEPEIWAYYADYDWVAFCQLFGTMMDLPKGFPMYVNDLKQVVNELGNPELPKQNGDEHNAIADARWVKDSYLWLQQNYKHPALR